MLKWARQVKKSTGLYWLRVSRRSFEFHIERTILDQTCNCRLLQKTYTIVLVNQGTVTTIHLYTIKKISKNIM
jgi:hypothetical protein